MDFVDNGELETLRYVQASKSDAQIYGDFDSIAQFPQMLSVLVQRLNG